MAVTDAPGRAIDAARHRHRRHARRCAAGAARARDAGATRIDHPHLRDRRRVCTPSLLPGPLVHTRGVRLERHARAARHDRRAGRSREPSRQWRTARPPGDATAAERHAPGLAANGARPAAVHGARAARRPARCRRAVAGAGGQPAPAHGPRRRREPVDGDCRRARIRLPPQPLVLCQQRTGLAALRLSRLGSELPAAGPAPRGRAAARGLCAAGSISPR